jgi:hypothetical protein
MTFQLNALGMAAWLFVTTLAASVSAAERSPVDRFRDLLSSPPAYVEALWMVESAENWSMTPRFVSTNVQLTRWQTNAYLMGFGTSPEQFDGPRWDVPHVQSRYGEEVWWADSLSVHYGVYSNNRANDTFKQVAESEGVTYLSLTLGIGMLKPGTARWTSETTFEGECLSKDRNVCLGEITEVDQGQVKAVKFWSPAFPGFTHTVKYHYSNTNLPPHIPSRIDAVVPRKQGARSGLLSRYEILSWRFSDTVMPREAFNAEGLASTNGIVPPFMVRYTNGVGYYVAGGALRTFRRLTWLERNVLGAPWAPDWLERVPYPESLARADSAGKLKRRNNGGAAVTPEHGTRLLLPVLLAFVSLALAVGLVRRRLKTRTGRTTSKRSA